MNKAVKRASKIILWCIGSLLVLIIALVLLIRLPVVQNYITGKAVAYVSSKTHTRIKLKRIFIGFPKDVVIEGLYAEDTQHDTLAYIRKLAVNIDMLALLKKKVVVSEVTLDGVTGYVSRNADSVYNFDFLITAFSSSNKKKPKEQIQEKTDSVGWAIEVDKVNLHHIRGGFSDMVGGTIIKGFVGDLKLNMKAMNIKHLSFNGNELALSNADVSFIQQKKGAEKPDTSVVLMPLLSLNKLQLQQVHFLYDDQVNNQRFDIHSGTALIAPDTIDLNAHLIKVKQLHLDSSFADIALTRNKGDKKAITSEPVRLSKTDNGWYVFADELKLKSLRFNFNFTDAPKLSEGFDYNHIGLRDINIEITKASYSPERILADIQNLSLKEQSGVNLKRLSAKAVYDDHHAQLDALTLITNNTYVSNRLGISYPSINSLGKNISQLGINADLRNTKVDVKDILLFAPQLKNQNIIAANANKSVSISGRINGRLGDLTADDLHVVTSDSTRVNLNAHITGLPNPLNSTYDVTFNDIRTTANSLNQFTGNRIPNNIELPQNISLTGSVKGSIKDAHAHLSLRTSLGSADIDATFKQVNTDTQYIVKISAHDLDIGEILKKKDLLGPVTLTATVNGQNFSPNILKTDAQVNIESAVLNKYDYKNLAVTANADSGIYSAQLSIKDTSLVMNLDAKASFTKGKEFVTTQIHIDGADLERLSLVKQNMRASGDINVNLKGPLDSLNGTAKLNNVLVLKDGNTYHLDSLEVVSVNDEKHSSLHITSPLVDANYDGSFPVQKITKPLLPYFNHYFRFSDTLTKAALDTNAGNYKLTVKVFPHPLISNVLVPGLANFDGADVNSSFDSKTSSFKLITDISSIAYGGVKASEVKASVTADGKALNYSVSLETLNAGEVKLSQTSFYGTINDNNIDFALRIKDHDTLSKLLVTGDFKQDSTKDYVLHLDNKGLVINNEKWGLTDDNYIQFGRQKLIVHNLELNNQSQLLSVKTEEENKDNLKVIVKKFELGTLSRIIEQDTALIRGTMDGNIELRNIHHAMAFISDLQINNIFFKGNSIGNLQVKADNLTADKYVAQVALNGFDNDVKARGYYSAAGNTNNLDFKVNINRLNLVSVEPFTFGQLRRSSGYVAGELSVTGSAKQPAISGDVRLKDAAFNLAYINNYLRLKDEHIAIDDKGIYFRSFTILDSLGQKASVSGSVYTTNFKNMRFDVLVNTDDFMVMNTTIKDNPLFYGKVLLNSNIRISGTEQLPIVRANLKLIDGTNFAVVIPSSKISTDRGDGVVVLVDTINANNIMSPKDTITLAPQFKGVDLSATVEISKGTNFKLIVDKSSGDSLVVRGEGVLSFTMDETGAQTLTGTYNLEGGSYKATFQKVIKRELKIQPGGSIVWNGTPLDANVNLTAIYTVHTSPEDLLSSELAASTPEEKNAYKRLMDFNVLMTMKGELLKPEISFKLDISESDQNAFGGTVYSKITSLNNDPSELNKQVFALLVLGKFIPAGIGGGGSGTDYNMVATNLARNSVNQILTDQLNALSGRFIKGVDLNVGIAANDEYSGSGVTQNTQFSASVKKSFFKERLSVQVGTSINVQNDNGAVKGADAQNLTGDIVLEYKINPDGSLRFKAFRQNQYEGLIDGSLYVTGVGVIYNKDYDKEKELFATKKKQKKEQKAQ